VHVQYQFIAMNLADMVLVENLAKMLKVEGGEANTTMSVGVQAGLQCSLQMQFWLCASFLNHNLMRN
jgi:hypothetical protein